ncbi:MAG: hypothetical protein ABIC95_01700 [archaeon]
MVQRRKIIWKKLQDSADLIVFENRRKGVTGRIEARKDNGRSWQVYRIFIYGKDRNYVEQYKAHDKTHLKELLTYLSKKGEPTTLEIKSGMPDIPMVQVEFRRAYKEEYVEKWEFSIDKEGFQNFLTARFDQKLAIDIVMRDKYKSYEASFLHKLDEFLGTASLDVKKEFRIHYFEHSVYHEKAESEDDEITLSETPTDKE